MAESLIIKKWATGETLYTHDVDEEHHKSLQPPSNVTYPSDGELMQAPILMSTLEFEPMRRPIVISVGDPHVYEAPEKPN